MYFLDVSPFLALAGLRFPRPNPLLARFKKSFSLKSAYLGLLPKKSFGLPPLSGVSPKTL